MPSVSSRMMPALVRATGRSRPLSSADAARKHVERLSIRPLPYGPPRRLRPDVSVSAERLHGWPIYTVTPRVGTARGRVIYVHGGGWVNEIAAPHWRLIAQIAAEAHTTVTVPIYTLVPFATAEQVIPVVAELASAGDTAASLAGDSAGGQIVLSVGQFLRDDKQLTVPRTVLISPALDLSFDNPQIDMVELTDPWLARAGVRVYVEHWRGELPLTDPRVSPLAGDLKGLGALTVFSGTRDILNPDARLLVDRARAAGVDIDYHEGRGLLHVYPLTPTLEGRAARTVIVEALRAARPAI